MKNKFITLYGIAALIVLVLSIVAFAFSIVRETDSGIREAEKSFDWISREAVSASFNDGFMTDGFIRDLTGLCRKSRLLSAVVINTPSGTVFAWPDNSPAISYDIYGKPQINGSSLFTKVYSESLDIGDGATGSVIMTAVLNVLPGDTIFAASRNSFLVILALLFVTIVIIMFAPKVMEKAALAGQDSPLADDITSVQAVEPAVESAMLDDDEGFSLSAAPDIEVIVQTDEDPYPGEEPVDYAIDTPVAHEADVFDSFPPEESPEEVSAVIPDVLPVAHLAVPEGLFSPTTGTGWEQYLSDRLEAELVRAASSEQDLSLIIIRVSGLLHTDLISRKIAQVLVDAFRFKDMVFEFGTNGFAGILQNVNLDEAMKTADILYSGIDSILMEMSFDGQITIGITTRTARLLPASRMIEEAVSAARKAEEEPTLPIVAFRANPEKYRNFVAEKSS